MYSGYTLASPCFFAMPSVPWHLPQVFGNIQRIHRRARIRLGKNRVRVSMATRAGMLRRIRMNAPCQSFRLIRVAALALHLRHLLRMRILLDVRVAIVALKASVNALAKGLPIHGDAVPVRILHGLVAMARQALRLRIEPAGREHQQQPGQSGNQNPAAHEHLRPACQRLLQDSPYPCGFAHPAVFLLREIAPARAVPGLPVTNSGPTKRVYLCWVRTLEVTPWRKNPQ